MTVVEDSAPHGLARRLLLSRADLEFLEKLLPGHLPAPMIPTGELVLGSEPSRESIVDGLVQRGVVVPEATGFVAAPSFRRTWGILTSASTAIELVVTGQGHDRSVSTPVGQHAWIAVTDEAAASMRTVDAHRAEVSAFLSAGLAHELQGLIPEPGGLIIRLTESIAQALASPTTPVADGADGDERLEADSPDAAAVTRSIHVNLRCTVMTRTPRGPAAGTLTWVATPTAWWQVDLDWRRWQRTGEKQTVLARLRTDEAGRTLMEDVARLLRAGAGLHPTSVGVQR